MKASIAHTSEGRTKVLLDEKSENIETYFKNLGGILVETFWIFSRRDSEYVVESLKDEGYEVKTTQLL